MPITNTKRLMLSALGAASVLASLMAAALPARAQVLDPLPPVLLTRDSYLIVTHIDQRMCVAPGCGGYFVKGVNTATTRCADGTLQKECHAYSLDTALLGWTDAQRAAFEAQFAKGRAVVRGWLETAPLPGTTGLSIDSLKLTEAWQAQGKHIPAGIFYSVKDTGVRCITAPCPSLAATKLNTAAAALNPDLDLSLTGATSAQVQAAYEALASTGILAAGAIVPVKLSSLSGATVKGSKLLASNFYLPAKP
jgi:hypothetical protein